MFSWPRWFSRIRRAIWDRLAAWGCMPLGLQGKVLAMYLASTLVILPATALLYSQALADQISEEYKEEALGIWRIFDATYASGDELRGPLVQERVERMGLTNPDVHEIRVYTAMDGRFLAVASSVPAAVGQPAVIDDLQPMLQNRAIWRELSVHGEPLLELGAPLHNAERPIGVLIVHFRLEPRDQIIRRQVATYAGITGAGGLLLLAALYWELRRVVLQPLVVLQRHATAIMHGDLGFRTEIKRRDEVGQLARDFNEMAATLEQRQQENVRLHVELQHRYEEAEQRAVRDPLTDLYNHRHFFERLSHEVARSRRFGQSMGLLFCDLDHFKVVNDTYGHQAGDQVLQQVAAILKASIREIDIPARYGGEEFAVILPNAVAASAVEVAERIRSQVSATAVALTPTMSVTVTISIGVVCYPDDATSDDELVHRADLAMYQAKRLGRNQVRMYQEIRDLASFDQGAGDWQRDEVYFEAVQSLAAAVDVRDHYTHRHSDSVSRYATALARVMGLEGAHLTEISIAGLLHDVGKIGIPDQILGKTGALTEEEWTKMREHPDLGKSIVQHITAYERMVPLILHHHERWDGLGYPGGVAGETIPLGARIIAVADAYHAMTSDRPYRPAMSRATALKVLREEAGRQFDPEIVEAFLQIPEEALIGADESAGEETRDCDHRTAAHAEA